MIHEIAPHRYDLTYRIAAPEPDGALLVYSGDDILCGDGEQLRLPRVGELAVRDTKYLFAIDGQPYYLAQAEQPLPAGWRWRPYSELRGARPSHLAFAGLTGRQLALFYGGNRYCGSCGAAMRPSAVERAMCCPQCGRVVYPQICPSVIVAVTDGDRILLTRYAPAHSRFRHYALIAGYNEIGESLEETVRREVMEEVGLRVKDIRYYKSQPWAFSGALLSGFYCKLDGSADIRLDTDELQEGTWVPRAELDPRPDSPSLTGEMIEQFRLGHQD